MELGTIKRGNEIGIKCANNYVWQACGDCGEARWVRLVGGEPWTSLCRMCAPRSSERRRKLSESLTGRVVPLVTRQKISKTKKKLGRFYRMKRKLEQEIREYMELCPALGKPDEETVLIWAVDRHHYKDMGQHNGWVKDLIEKATAGIKVSKKRTSTFSLYPETKTQPSISGDYIPSEMIGIGIDE